MNGIGLMTLLLQAAANAQNAHVMMIEDGDVPNFVQQKVSYNSLEIDTYLPQLKNLTNTSTEFAEDLQKYIYAKNETNKQLHYLRTHLLDLHNKYSKSLIILNNLLRHNITNDTYVKREDCNHNYTILPKSLIIQLGSKLEEIRQIILQQTVNMESLGTLLPHFEYLIQKFNIKVQNFQLILIDIQEKTVSSTLKISMLSTLCLPVDNLHRHTMDNCIQVNSLIRCRIKTTQLKLKEMLTRYLSISHYRREICHLPIYKNENNTFKYQKCELNSCEYFTANENVQQCFKNLLLDNQNIEQCDICKSKGKLKVTTKGLLVVQKAIFKLRLNQTEKVDFKVGDLTFKLWSNTTFQLNYTTLITTNHPFSIIMNNVTYNFGSNTEKNTTILKPIILSEKTIDYLLNGNQTIFDYIDEEISYVILNQILFIVYVVIIIISIKIKGKCKKARANKTNEKIIKGSKEQGKSEYLVSFLGKPNQY
jgi:hypothetical protein